MLVTLNSHEEVLALTQPFAAPFTTFILYFTLTLALQGTFNFIRFYCVINYKKLVVCVSIILFKDVLSTA
jgi:hypothetical protein